MQPPFKRKEPGPIPGRPTRSPKTDPGSVVQWQHTRLLPDEMRVQIPPDPLRKIDRASSRGRTAVSEAVNEGSIPSARTERALGALTFENLAGLGALPGTFAGGRAASPVRQEVKGGEPRGSPPHSRVLRMARCPTVNRWSKDAVGSIPSPGASPTLQLDAAPPLYVGVRGFDPLRRL